MSKVASLVGGMVLGSLLTVGAQNYHVVNSRQGLTVVPKRHSSFSQTYVDVRGWGVTDWARNPDLLWTMHQHQRNDVLGDASLFGANLNDAQNMFQQQFNNAADQFQNNAQQFQNTAQDYGQQFQVPRR